MLSPETRAALNGVADRIIEHRKQHQVLYRWNDELLVELREHLRQAEALLKEIGASFAGEDGNVALSAETYRPWVEQIKALGLAPQREAEPTKCPRCEGCGRLADTDALEPWSAWENLPVNSAFAVIVGAVRPVPCYLCQGTGLAPAPELSR